MAISGEGKKKTSKCSNFWPLFFTKVLWISRIGFIFFGSPIGKNSPKRKNTSHNLLISLQRQALLIIFLFRADTNFTSVFNVGQGQVAFGVLSSHAWEQSNLSSQRLENNITFSRLSTRPSTGHIISGCWGHIPPLFGILNCRIETFWKQKERFWGSMRFWKNQSAYLMQNLHSKRIHVPEGALTAHSAPSSTFLLFTTNEISSFIL
jgi:hypothetical protein